MKKHIRLIGFVFCLAVLTAVLLSSCGGGGGGGGSSSSPNQPKLSGTVQVSATANK